ITSGIVSEVLKAQERTGLALVAFDARDPGAYGRVLMTPDGFLNRIVEFKDASEAERKLTLCNSGLYAADAKKFFLWVAALKNNNAQGEYYLTDMPVIARTGGVKCALAFADEALVAGVNSRAELAAAENLMQQAIRQRFLGAGVGMAAPETVHFSHDTVVGNDAVIEPYVVFAPGVSVASGAIIRSFSHLEGASAATGAVSGTYARMRPGATIGERA